MEKQLSLLEVALKQQLTPIFPNLSENIIDICVSHPSNLTNLQICIDDLLELRTYTRHLAQGQATDDGKAANDTPRWREDMIFVNSDDDSDLVGALDDLEKDDDIMITLLSPPTRRIDSDCIVTDDNTKQKKIHSPVKIHQAKFVPQSSCDTSPYKTNLLNNVEFDSDLPRLCSPSRVDKRSPAVSSLNASSATPHSIQNKTSNSVLDTEHNQWHQTPVQSLFSPASTSAVNGSISQTSDSYSLFLPKKRHKSANFTAAVDMHMIPKSVSGIISPAKLKLHDFLHRPNFAAELHESSPLKPPAPILRAPVFNPGKDAAPDVLPTVFKNDTIPPVALSNGLPITTTSLLNSTVLKKQFKFSKPRSSTVTSSTEKTLTESQPTLPEGSGPTVANSNKTYIKPSSFNNLPLATSSRPQGCMENEFSASQAESESSLPTTSFNKTTDSPSTSELHLTTDTNVTYSNGLPGISENSNALHSPSNIASDEINPTASNRLQSSVYTNNNRQQATISNGHSSVYTNSDRLSTVTSDGCRMTNSKTVPTTDNDSRSHGTLSSSHVSKTAVFTGSRPPVVGLGTQATMSSTSTFTKPPATLTSQQAARPATSTFTKPPATVTSQQAARPATSTFTKPPATVTSQQTTKPATSTARKLPETITSQQTAKPATLTMQHPATLTSQQAARPAAYTFTKPPATVTSQQTAKLANSTAMKLPATLTSQQATRPTTSTLTKPPATITSQQAAKPATSISTAMKPPATITSQQAAKPATSVSMKSPASVTSQQVTKPATSTYTKTPATVTSHQANKASTLYGDVPPSTSGRNQGLAITGDVHITIGAEPVLMKTGRKEESAPKTKTETLTEDVLALFGDADPAYIQRLVAAEIADFQPDYDIVNNICNRLLENLAYPRVQPSATATKSDDHKTQETDTTDYYQEYKKDQGETRSLSLYQVQSEKLLMSQFPWISASCVRQVLRMFKRYYAPAHQVFTQVMKQRRDDIKKDHGDVAYNIKLNTLHSAATVNINIKLADEEMPYSVTLLKSWRRTSPPSGLEPYLQREANFIKRKQLDEFEEADHQLALMLNETEYEESGQLIECGCCYGEVPFENMIQCYEGHLFCDDCLQRYAKEAVFGSGKADLMCMTAGCDASYPINQLSKALPSNILNKYEDRVQEENLNLADLPNLVRCPHCDFAAMLDPGYPVFQCANPACEKETCRHCQEDWTDHRGKTCKEVEKKDEVKLRVQFEEKMTQARIRTCFKCKTKFTKSEGCNKMTCRCGSKMCYICRQPNIDYNHFCQHVRDPGKGCDKCKACFLWSTGEEDDTRAIEEIRKQAEEARKAQGFEDSKLIGAPDEPPTKKARPS